MGGNAKYRSHTAVIRNPYNESGFQAMRDANGNLIRIPESNSVGRGQRTNTTAVNAKERMLNAQAIKDLRDTAKEYRAYKSLPPIGTQFGSDFTKRVEEMKKQKQRLDKLASIANSIQPGAVDFSTGQTLDQAEKAIEMLLNIKL